MKIKGVVFDMDGTLCLPQNYMFAQMRSALGIDKSVDILDHVHSLPPAEEHEAQLKLQRIERTAMLDMKPQPGLDQLFDSLKKTHKLAICTRNFPIPVDHLLTSFLGGVEFDPVITREFKPPKPAPDGILAIALSWNLKPEEMVMVGDSIDDMKAGHSAGATTVLLNSEFNVHLRDSEFTDHAIDSLPELLEVLESI